jgi:hypothetical protein
MRLFKFRQGNSDDLKALENSQLWFARTDTLNDLEEFSWVLDQNAPMTEWVNLLCEFYQRRLAKSNTQVQLDDMIRTVIRMQQPGAEIKDIPQIFLKGIDSFLNDIKNSIGICSMAMACEDHMYPYPLTNPNIWKEYAKHTEGMSSSQCYCLEYDSTVLDSFFDSGENGKFTHGRVQYSDNNTVVITVSDYAAYLKNERSSDLLRKTSKAAFTKKSKWHEEVEYRFISGRVGLQSIPVEALKAIYVPNSLEEKIRDKLFGIVDRQYPSAEKIGLTLETSSVGFRKL